MTRTFIAIDLPLSVKEEIGRIQKLIWKNTSFEGKLTEHENLHLTLKFLGEIDEDAIEKVKKILAEIKMKAFNVECSEVGVFSKDFIKIVWLKLDSNEIYELQKNIDEKLKGLFQIEARFMSHVTMIRIKNVKDKNTFLDYLKSIKPKKISFILKEFSLKKSDLQAKGPIYEDIENFKLAE
jgi:RNA 2',3'-cyclic 3'-phosphodiesterase